MDVNRLCPYCMREMMPNAQFCNHCGKDPHKLEVSMHQLRPFTILRGKYLVGTVLGEGGFGITYIGLDMNLEVRVAIKEFYPNGYVSRDNTQTSTVTQFNNSNSESVRKWKDGFVKEARALGKVQDLPGIVGVKDFFEENQTAYIVMEYIDGKTLKQYAKENGGKLPPEQLLPAIRPIMNSLQRVHDMKVIHRDISPDNIMLLPNGTMKLLDFGAARRFDNDGENKSLSVMLKPGYAPEEQYRTHGEQGPWSDVYAFAGTIYKCITGVTPVESMERMRTDSLKSPRSLGVNISPAQDAAIMKAMAVYAEDRYKSMAEFENALFNGTGKSFSPAPSPVPAPGPAPQPVPGPGPLPVPGPGPMPGPALGPVPGQKKNSLIPVIIAVCVVAFIIVAALAVNSINKSKNAIISKIGGGDTAAPAEDKEQKEEVSLFENKKEEITASVTAEPAKEADSWNMSYYDALTTVNSSTWGGFTLTDMNEDGTPELICFGKDSGSGCRIYTYSPGGASYIDLNSMAVSYVRGKNRILESYADSNRVFNIVYSIENGQFRSEFDGEVEQKLDILDNNCDPSVGYYIDDNPSNDSQYYDKLNQIIFSNGVVDTTSLNAVSYIDILDALTASDYEMALMTKGQPYNPEVDWYFGFKPELQMFVAPYTGIYRVSLKGGAGGEDNYYEDRINATGALLRGNMYLMAGESLIVITGGKGENATLTQEYVSGGFNGGGAAFFSGAGGGCTDVYYNGIRVAAASGASGAGFEEKSDQGRTSTMSAKTTGSKIGGTCSADAGGGGGGWKGGAAASKKDEAGQPGISGYDSYYFALESEEEGDRYGGFEDGYAEIELLDRY